MWKKIGYSFSGVILILGVAFFMGPSPDYPEIQSKLPDLEIPLAVLDQYIAEKEEKVKDLKLDNEARIIWVDSISQQTPYSVVYLHGFSASQEEGDPIHEDFATRYGCNLYLPRLEDHGRADSNTFKKLTPEALMASAREAIAIGHLIGEKVIVMSCSTGSTLSAFLAAHHPDIIHSQIMYSPNIEVYDPMSTMLTYPWGLQMAEMSFGSEYNRIQYTQEAAQYWNEVYHVQGLIALKSLINETMKEETFRKIHQPLFLGYYYKNEEEQDKVVSVERMHDFYNQVSTPASQKLMIPFPQAGRHVIASHIMSGDVDGVRAATFDFAEKILGLIPKYEVDKG